MCKHENVKFVQTIEAYHQRIFCGDDEYYCNNEYGGTIRINVECSECGLSKTITHHNEDKQPKWIKDKISIMREGGDWFFL